MTLLLPGGKFRDGGARCVCVEEGNSTTGAETNQPATDSTTGAETNQLATSRENMTPVWLAVACTALIAVLLLVLMLRKARTKRGKAR